jgi:hypothetical protein
MFPGFLYMVVYVNLGKVCMHACCTLYYYTRDHSVQVCNTYTFPMYTQYVTYANAIKNDKQSLQAVLLQ